LDKFVGGRLVTEPVQPPPDTESDKFGCWIVAVIVAGMIGVCVLVTSNTYGKYFASERALEIAVFSAFVVAVFAVGTIWRYSGQSARYFRKNADRRLASMHERLVAELESADREHRIPNTERIRTELKSARTFVPERAEIETLERLLDSGERAAAADPSRKFVPPEAVNLRRAFDALFNDRETRPISVAAASVFGCGLLLVGGGALGHSGRLELIGFLIQWGGLATLFRRESVIIRVAGSLVFACFATVTIIQMLGGKP
jgi:hypothetical protein